MIEEMNDKTSSSSLAITEKRPQRSGGCVGIFFQLFDWNRRLAKKKLFSKKLLPPARAKRVSKKFGGNEKLPMAKLLLIADENCGGFPNSKKSETNNVNSSMECALEMRAPGLVARLMGLESMPNVRRDKPKKASFSELNHNYEKKSDSNHTFRTSEHFGCEQDDFQLNKKHTKLESRPQKLQKTGLFERQPVTRFGTEALQFKNVMSLSRKHHPKLTSPVKSPRIGRNASRLMEAATKILEPGLQATNKAKFAITYSSSLHFHPKEFTTDGTAVITPDLSKQPSYYVSGGKSLKGQSSCKSCGNWLDVVDSRSTVEDHILGFASSASGLDVVSSQGPGRSEFKPPIPSFDQDRDVGILKNHELSFGSEAKDNTRIKTKNLTDRKPQLREAQDCQRYMSSQRIKYQNNVGSGSAPKQRIQQQSQMSLAEDRAIPKSKSNNLQSKRDSFTVGSVIGAKDFVASNRNATSHTRARMPSKKVSDNCKMEIERNAWNKRDDSSSRPRASIRKRRSINGNVQVENSVFFQSTFEKQRNVGGDVIIGKVVGLNACSMNQNDVKSDCSSEAKVVAAGVRKDADVVSFMFSSPMKQRTQSSFPKETMEKTKGQVGLMNRSFSQHKKLTMDANTGNSSSQMETKLKRDALGILLEEKLKELTSRDTDESEMGDALTGRSTAAILEELILALTATKPSSLEDGDTSLVGFNQEDSFCYGSEDPSNSTSLHHQAFNMSKKFQTDVKEVGGLVGFHLVGDGDQPSPGSVLDASFSNDSCFSESLDGTSGHKLHFDSLEFSYDQVKPLELDADLSDSATSLNLRITGCDKMTGSLHNFSSMVYGIDPTELGLVGNKLKHSSEVIVNAGIVFGSTGLSDAIGVEDFSIGPLLDKLEILSNTSWTSAKCSMGFLEAKDGHRLRRFLFDCLIECLDSKYGHCCKSRYTWPKMLLHVKGEDFMTREVYGEITRWTNLAGKNPDEIIEREMSHSLGKWTDFEIESFETGSELELDILGVMIDEMVFDLWWCRPGSS